MPSACIRWGLPRPGPRIGPRTDPGRVIILHSSTTTNTKNLNSTKKAQPQGASKDASKGASKDAAKAAAKGPLQIIISIADQRISLYDNGALIARSSVSTGVQGHPTPLGIFSVISKERWHRSNIYSAAPMPYMQRITWSGIALHAGVLPGYPASHGCIRLTNDFAIRLWHLTKRGTRVIIAPEDVQPVEIATRTFLYRNRKLRLVRRNLDTCHLAGSGTTRRMQRIPGSCAGTWRGRQSGSQIPRAAGAAPQKVVPISVFVSRKLSRLFVRQGLTPLLDIPVKIHNPEEPLGTHVFTAMELQKDSASFAGPSCRYRRSLHTVKGLNQDRKKGTTPGPTSEALARGRR